MAEATTQSNAASAATAQPAEGTFSARRVRHLVVDSGAIIKEVPLHDLADNLWTIPDVIQEIKDRRARHVLESLPKRLQLREPSAEAINFIINFSRRTGDFRSISDADIKVRYPQHMQHAIASSLPPHPPPSPATHAARRPQRYGVRTSLRLAPMLCFKEENESSHNNNNGETLYHFSLSENVGHGAAVAEDV